MDNEVELPKLLLTANNGPLTRRTYVLTKSVRKPLRNSTLKGRSLLKKQVVPTILKAKRKKKKSQIQSFEGTPPHFNGSCTLFQGRKETYYPLSPDSKLKWVENSTRFFPFCIREASFRHMGVVTSGLPSSGRCFLREKS